MEIARLAQLCGIRMLQPGVAEAVLRNDSSLCNSSQPGGLGQAPGPAGAALSRGRRETRQPMVSRRPPKPCARRCSWSASGCARSSCKPPRRRTSSRRVHPRCDAEQRLRPGVTSTFTQPVKGEPQVSRRVKFACSLPLAGSRRGWSKRCTWLSPCTSSTSPAKASTRPAAGRAAPGSPAGTAGAEGFQVRVGLLDQHHALASGPGPSWKAARHPGPQRPRCARRTPGRALRRGPMLLPPPGTLRVAKSTGPICQRRCSPVRAEGRVAGLALHGHRVARPGSARAAQRTARAAAPAARAGS